MRVVLDTNILVSGLMSLTSPPARILDAVRTGQIVAVMSEITLAELEHVLSRPAVRRYFSHAAITPDVFLADLRLHADLVIPVPTTTAIRDEGDRPFLDLMTTTPPPQYFITGDKDFEAAHYSGVPVISSAEFARLLTRR
ncbi:MAG: putative toxin-antitoxin system toxin component, PIN family [Nitrospiraceae bacterium]|nr:MAG: putative toxin-antitoxin system toxin component, PIN family [Nitrospiraceae bacterium]